MWAEKTFGGILFFLYAEVYKKEPFAAERLLDLPVGGIDDIPLLLNLAFLGHGCWLGHHGINLWLEWIGIENR